MTTRKSRTRARTSAPSGGGNETARAINDSAQKIWLAGLGAFERARAEGPRMFDTLVEQGKSLGGQAREAADQALRTLKEQASGAGGRFDKLEQVFEDRVSRSLRRLGVITRSEVADLSQGVRELSDQVREMMAQQGAATANTPGRGAKGAGRTARKATRTARSTARKAASTTRSAGRKAANAARSATRATTGGRKRRGSRKKR
jgi:poly(hydroxyalkanoate) granule-associated protein